jgi:hypothetical protein
MLEMVDPPKLMAVLDKIVGEDAILAGMQVRHHVPRR